MFLVLIEILATLLVGLVTFMEIRRLMYSRKYRHIRSVPEVPIIGSTYALRPNTIQDLSLFFNDFVKEKINKAFIGPVMIFVVADPSVIQQMFVGNNWIERPFFFDFFRLKYGLITSKHHIWKPIRKAVNPAFSQRMGLSFIPIFERHFNQLGREIEGYMETGETFNFNEKSVDFGIKIILETNFGVTEVDERFNGKLFEQYEDNLCQRIFSPLIWHDSLYRLSSLGKFDRKIDDMMKELFTNMTVDRNRHWQTNEADPDAVNGGRLFIDEIINHSKSGGYKDNEMLIDNMITIFAAGYETAALTVSYGVLMLAMHPEIDAKVMQEIFEHYEPGTPITHEALRNMTYLDQVIRETMRLFPPAPMTARQNMEDTHIDEIGHIKKGTVVGISFYNLHRWKDVWGEDANEFNPDHFSEENTAKRHAYAFLPFSGGAKTCIGYQYAMINIKVGLVSLLSRFRFSTHLRMEELECKFSVTFKLVNKHLVKVHPRHFDRP